MFNQPFLTRERHFSFKDMTANEITRTHVLHEQGSIVREHLNLLEVMEWWLVTERLAEKLKQYGEIVLESFGSYWWGRKESGQPIEEDWIIQLLAKKNEEL